MKKKISILGCGWLGLPLARYLISKGFDVNGSVTSHEKLESFASENFKAYKINFNPTINDDYSADFFRTDVLFINIPPGRKNLNPTHFEEINKNIISKINGYAINNVIFISSTSVYPDINKTVDERCKLPPNKESGKLLLKTEKLYLEKQRLKTTVIRFGGLIGEERNPANFLSGKINVANAKAPVNLIHLKDCLQIVHTIVAKNEFGAIYNACMPEHPTREEFYLFSANKYKLKPPLFKKENECKFKIVDSSKLMNKLKYNFSFSNPFDCI